MRRFEFHVYGITQDNLRRLRLSGPTAGSRVDAGGRAGARPRLGAGLRNVAGLPSALVWAVIAGAVIYAVWTNPTAMINGAEFKGKRVLVLVDTSGSMESAREELNKQLDRLRAQSVSVSDPITIDGFGVSEKGEASNLLHRLEEGLRDNPEIDSIYIFTDFLFADDDYFNARFNNSDSEGYERLHGLIAEHSCRIYLHTVGRSPSKELVDITRESGGGVIEGE